MRSIVLGVVAVSSVLGSARADTDSLTDMLGPREIAVGEAGRGDATGASAIGLNPGGLPLNRELVFEGGYGYRPTDAASLVGVSACDSTNAMPGCFFYEYAGSNPVLDDMTLHRTTHVFGASLSKQLVPRVSVGAAAKYYHLDTDVMGEQSGSGFTFDVGGTLRVTDMINFGLAGQNLWSTNSSPDFPRALGGGIMARPIPILSLSFDSRWKLDGAQQGARYGGGAELFLRGSNGQMGYPLRAGILHDNGLNASYVSGGFGLAGLKWGVDVGARKQFKGGDETMIVASMRFYGPRLAAPGIE